MQYSDEPPRHALRTTRRKKAPFPLIEGVGILIGVMAWDLLNQGYVNIDKAFLIAAPCTALWFAVRCWRSRVQRGPEEREETNAATHEALGSDH